MDAPGAPTPRERPVRQPVLLGLFAGAGIAAGYLLAGVPGVELMTLVAALAGIALGPARGALAGGIAEAVYSVGSPYGIAAPPLLAAQVAGVALAGVLGALAAPALRRAGRTPRAATLAGILGVAAALVFDILTNLGIVAGYGLDWRAVAVGALGMTAVHVAVNAAVFASLLPALAPRVAVLGQGVWRAGSALALVAVLAVSSAGAARAQPAAAAPDTALAAADTLASARTAPAPLSAGRDGDPGPAALGWKRPLWTPFSLHALNWLEWWSPRVVAAEGGLGAPAIVLGEAVTSPAPLVTVDGVPWGTGHALADDPWLIPQQGLRWAGESWYADPLGGTAGRLELVTDDPDPARATSTYLGVKGRHESYVRAIDVLTAEADWRAAFAFEEAIDNESYNYSDDPDEIFQPSPGWFRGHGKVRQSRTRLQRLLDRENRLTLEVSTARKTKDDLPVWGVDHQEIWDTGIAATMEGAGGAVAWRTIVHWRDRDVLWSDKTDRGDSLIAPRKVETAREGVVLELRPRPAAGPDLADSLGILPVAAPTPLSSLRLSYHQWYVGDSLDTLTVWPPEVGAVDGRGRQVRAEATTGWRFGGHRLEGSASGVWDERIDIAPGWRASFGQDADRPHWRLDVAGDGRAPRSDELLTPVERDIAGRRLVLWPNEDLEREHTLRAALVLRAWLLGTEFAVDAAGRRLSDGITWTPLPGATQAGRWGNDLEMDSARVTASLQRQGRFLGWGRVLLEGTWQTFTERQGQAAFLPPELSGRLALFWENHFFREDGILQLGLISTYRGEMDDPWDVTRSTALPARTVHDLLLGFRLVGAHLSMGIKNLTGERVRLSAGTTSPGQEIDLRLRWSFRH